MKLNIFSNQEIRYRPDIDGFRALAVLSVLVFHFNANWLPGGFLGVDVFFVISGYLITSIIRNQLSEERFSFKDFYTRRIKRILPLLFTVLLVTCFTAYIILLPEDYKSFWRTVRYSMQFRANQAFMNQGYFEVSSEEKPLLHLWSLAIEEQFYFIWPIVLILLYKIVKNKKVPLIWLFWTSVLGIVISTLVANYTIIHNTESSYFLLKNRASELLVGCALALNPYKLSNPIKKVLGVIGVVVLILCFYFFNETTPYPGTFALIPTIAAALFILDNNVSGHYKSVFTNRYVRLIGLWSFSLYLWHWPILAFMRYIRQDPNLPNSWILVAATLTLLLSIMSYYLIENPARRLNWGFKKSFICFLIVPILIITGGYYSTRGLQTEFIPIEKDQIRWFDDGEGCYDIISDDCSVGSLESETKYLLIGDSHAVHLAGTMDVIGKKEDIAFDIYSASGCPIYFGYSSKKETNELCISVNQYLKEHWREYDAILFSQFFHAQINEYAHKDTHKDYLISLNKTLIEISQEKPVVIISDVPDIGFHPPRLNRMKQLGFKSSYEQREVTSQNHVNANQQVQDLVKELDEVGYLDITLEVESLIGGEEIIYRDTNHLNPYGSRKIGQLFIQNRNIRDFIERLKSDQ